MRWLGVVVASTGWIFIASPAAYADTSTPPTLGNPVATVLKLFLSLGIIIVLAVLSIRFLSKKSQVAQKGAITVLAARQIAPNRSVQVIDVQGKRLLIGVGDTVQLLADVTDVYSTVEDAGVAGEPSAFGEILASRLQSLRNRYRSGDGQEPPR